MDRKQQVIDRLVAAYRKADAELTELYSRNPRASDTQRALAYSFIIGELQGNITLAAIDLGYYEPMKLKEKVAS